MDHERRDDWRNSVDERLVNLVSAQKTADSDIRRLRMEVEKIDRMIRGDPLKSKEGIAQSLDRLQAEVTKLNRILEHDTLGNGGLINDINFLMDKRKRSDRRSDHVWKLITAVAVQFLILIGLLVVNWDHIQEFVVLHEHIYQAAAIEKDTKKKKAQRAKHKHKVVPVPEVNDEPAGQNVSE